MRLNPSWASKHLCGNQLHVVSNGGPIGPPVAKILHIYQLIGWGGYWCGRLWIVSTTHFVMPPKRTVNTHCNTLHAFLMMAVGPPTQNSMLNFAAQGFNLRMLKVQLAITKKNQNLLSCRVPPCPEKPVIPDPMIHATEGDNCNQSHNG